MRVNRGVKMIKIREKQEKVKENHENWEEFIESERKVAKFFIVELEE